MSSEKQNPEQSAPKEVGDLTLRVDDLTLDKETLKDLEPRREDQDKVRGGLRFQSLGGCVGRP
jgi:hypothetical protein